LPFILGLVSLGYGWTQTWDVSVESADLDLYTGRLIRSYVFIIGGLILLVFSFIVNGISRYLDNLELMIYERTIERKDSGNE